MIDKPVPFQTEYRNIAIPDSVNPDAKIVGMFLATRRRKSEKTAEVYAGVLREFFNFMNFKAVRLINYEDLVNYSDYLALPDPGRNPVILAVSTQNRKISVIKSFFKYAMKIGYVPFNPAEPLGLQRVNSNIAQRLLTVDELEDLLVAARVKSLFHTVVIYFFACTGCRVSELSLAMWKDFFIGPQGENCLNIHGKGHKDRIIKINQSLWDIIIKYRKGKSLCTEINPNDLSPLLINKYGKAYSSQSLWKVVKVVAKEAGLNKKPSPHWLRHTFATEAAKDPTTNLWRLQQDLGHASLTTTQQYVHVAQDMADTSVDHLAYLDKLENHIEGD
ncbi:MAG: tyrosine-type recombinase/integrase [Syntrophomonadaceae bacterium]|nr:tyrosine-type recombinase/integrase [Syntrophomonadaceae bacterium]